MSFICCLLFSFLIIERIKYTEKKERWCMKVINNMYKVDMIVIIIVDNESDM
jgi:hypothetical protein